MKAAVRTGTTPIEGLFTFRDVYLPYTAAQMIRFFAPDFASKIGVNHVWMLWRLFQI